MTSLLQVPGSMSRDCMWGERANMTPRRSASFLFWLSPSSYHFCKLLADHMLEDQRVQLYFSHPWQSDCWVHWLPISAEWLGQLSTLDCLSAENMGWGWCANKSCSLWHYSATYIISKNSCQWVGTTPVCTTKILQLSVWWLLVRQLSTYEPRSWWRHSASFINR